MTQTSMSMNAPELSRWLLDNERKAILPFKFVLLSSTFLLWMWQAGWMLPPAECFAVFNVYFLLLLGEAYLVLMGRVTIREARALCFTSFFLDVMFISALIYCDAVFGPRTHGGGISDFYYFYFVLVMRGYSLSTSRVFNFTINLLIALIFVASFALTERSFGFIVSQTFLIRLGLLWMIILMSWFIVGLIIQQTAELMATRERLVKTQHLADLGEMAAVVAHEVNNPIGVISANAEFLMRQAGEESEQYEDFRVIRDESQRCKQIIADLLSYARPSRNVTALPTDMAALCREVIDFAFRQQDDGLTITFEADDDAPLALIDPATARQALLNVLLNARQVVSDKEGIVETRVTRSRGMVEVTVADNGPGISPEDAARAFEPFFTRRSGGTGLGLAVTRRVIEGQGGHVSIGPREDGEGAVVRLRLPVAHGYLEAPYEGEGDVG